MKKLILIFLSAFFIQTIPFAQSCLPEGITFSSQSEVNNFQTENPDCSEIEGDVVISGSDITDLSGLSVITSIGGNLEICYNTILTNLTGLDSLTTIGKHLYIGTLLDPGSGNPS